MRNRHRGRHVTALRASDLYEPTRPESPRQFQGRLVRLETRMTSRGVPWGVVTLEWRWGQQVRFPLFPKRWAASAPLVVGGSYHVVGTVSFRDGTPAIGILAITASARPRIRKRRAGRPPRRRR